MICKINLYSFIYYKLVWETSDSFCGLYQCSICHLCIFRF